MKIKYDINGINMVYHGSRREVVHPDLEYSRNDVDFGVGFYMTLDENMAKKWACNKNTSFLNVYELDLRNLKVHEFKVDEEWLNYCVANRFQETPEFREDDFDVLIGPTADDKLFNTLDMYADDLLSVEDTLKIVNCMNYSYQIVVKNQDAINSRLRFINSKELTGQEKQHFIALFRQDRQDANRKTEELIHNIKRGR